MMMNRSSLGYRALHGIIWGYLGKFSEMFLGFAFSIIVGRTLGPVIYGQYNLFINIATGLILFSSFGFESILNKFVPQVSISHGRSAAHKLFEKVFYLRLAIYLVLAAIIWLISPNLALIFGDPNINKLSILLVLIFLGKGMQTMLFAYFNAFLKLKEITLVNLFTQILGLGIVVGLFKLSQYSLQSVLVSVVVVAFVSILILFISSSKEKPEYRGTYKPEMNPYLKFGFSIWMVNLLTYALGTTLNTLLMGAILKDPFQIGLYSTAILFSYPQGNLVSSWSNVMLPSFSEARAKHGSEGLAKIIVSFMKIIFIMLIPATFFLGRYAGSFVNIFFGEKFFGSIILIQTFVIFSVFQILAGPHVSLNSLYALDKEKLVLRIRFLGGALNIALVFILAPAFKALGVMIAGCVAVTIQSLIEFFAMRRSLAFKYPLSYLLKVLTGSLGALLLWSWLPAKSLPELFLLGIAFIVSVGVIYHYIKLFTSEDKELLGRIHPVLGKICKFF